jgi:glycosyltransferase involved in cell wall biosynthesis
VTRGAAVVNPHFVGLQHLPFAFLRAIKLGPPLIFSVHGADVAGILKGSRAQRILCRWMYAKADLIVACSTALSADARRVNPRANVVVIWNGVSAPDVSQCERRLNARYIVSVASFHFHKGHDILLEAFDRISHIQTDLQLVLIGNNGPNLTRVQQDIRERKLENKTHVIVDVPHREVWFWLSHAECLVLASRSEPFGLCLVEAALTKTPVVATAVGGIPEIVAGGLHGLLSPPEDPEALAAAILKTLSEKAETADRVRRFHTFASTLTWENASNAYREHARLD